MVNALKTIYWIGIIIQKMFITIMLKPITAILIFRASSDKNKWSNCHGVNIYDK